MINCQLNQPIFILCNHFYELNLHQFHKDQQFLANQLMISTCLKMIQFLIIFCQEGISYFEHCVCMFKNTMSYTKKKRKTLRIHYYPLQNIREMNYLLFELSQTIFILYNHFYE